MKTICLECGEVQYGEFCTLCHSDVFDAVRAISAGEDVHPAMAARVEKMMSEVGARKQDESR